MDILWTREASDNVNSIVRYLDEHWSRKEANGFLNLLREWTNLIKLQPQAFPIINDQETIRASVLTKRITIFYRYSLDESQIIILSVFDTRQNPDKLNFDT